MSAAVPLSSALMFRHCVSSIAISSATLFLLGLTFLLGAGGCAGAPAIEGRLIEHAAVDAVATAKTPAGDRLGPAARLLSAGHVLQAGDGAVLQLYRQRVNRESGLNALELVTIALPAKLVRGRISIHEKALSATYSYSSGGDRLEAHGRSHKIEGQLTLQGRGSGVLVELEADALLDGGYRRRLSWNAQLPGTAIYDFRAWPTSTWTQGIWFLTREEPSDAPAR